MYIYSRLLLDVILLDHTDSRFLFLRKYALVRSLDCALARVEITDSNNPDNLGINRKKGTLIYPEKGVENWVENGADYGFENEFSNGLGI